MADDIPQWAIKRAIQVMNSGYTDRGVWRFPGDAKHETVVAVASYIAVHEEPPVDPLLVEARKLCANDIAEAGTRWAVESDDGHWYYGIDATLVILAGNADKSMPVIGRMRALKRGIELAESGEAQ